MSSFENMAIGGAWPQDNRNPFPFTTRPSESKKIDSDDGIFRKVSSEENVNLKGLWNGQQVRQNEGIPQNAYAKFAQGSLADFDVSNCNPFKPETRTAEQGQGVYYFA